MSVMEKLYTGFSYSLESMVIAMLFSFRQS